MAKKKSKRGVAAKSPDPRKWTDAMEFSTEPVDNPEEVVKELEEQERKLREGK